MVVSYWVLVIPFLFVAFVAVDMNAPMTQSVTLPYYFSVTLPDYDTAVISSLVYISE